MRKSRGEYEYSFEVERGNETVEYLCVYTVSPGEAPTGPTYDCGGTPGCGPEVESKEVFFLRTEPCPVHRFSFRPSARVGCRECKKVRDPRPEVEGLVSDEELLEHAGEVADAEYGAAVDAEIDRRRDDAREGR